MMGAAAEAIHELRRGPLLISTDRSLLDLDAIHGFLVGAYWCTGVPRETVERALTHSLPFGAYLDGAQAGLARVVSDRATFAYVADVFVLEPYRGKGIGKLLMEAVAAHPALQGLRTWMLLTRDAHGLYRQSGFEVMPRPERVMIKQDLALYTRQVPDSDSGTTGTPRDRRSGDETVRMR